jgi:ribosomal protein L7/L12
MKVAKTEMMPGLSKEDANKFVEQLKAAGATVELK